MISINLDLKNIVILICIAILFYIMFSPKITKEPVVIEPTEQYQPKIDQITDSFWSNIIIVENEKSKLYQYQLPDSFIVNPKYLMFHPNFTLNANKMVQIITELEAEAVAMLNLWVSLNKGLLDNEQNFSKLFETSIKRAIQYPSVVHKFKIEINNMVHTKISESPANLEFTEDLALSDVQRELPPQEIIDSINYEPEENYDSFQGNNNLAAF